MGGGGGVVIVIVQSNKHMLQIIENNLYKTNERELCFLCNVV